MPMIWQVATHHWTVVARAACPTLSYTLMGRCVAATSGPYGLLLFGRSTMTLI